LNALFFVVDVDEERRRMLRTKVKQGVAAAETLKKRMRESPPRIRPVPTTVSPSPSENCKFLIYIYSTCRKCFFIVDLKNDKELSDAYQHCLNGNQLVS
jgi:hypothetical protein